MIQLLPVDDSSQSKINEEIAKFLSKLDDRLVAIEAKLVELETRIEALENP
jgi:hypothetical protein